MPTLLLIRHGIAQDPYTGVKDADRALTPEGWDRTREAMRGLVRLGLIPTRAVSSPYRRAVETLACLQEVVGLEFPIACWEGLVPEGRIGAAETWLRGELAEMPPEGTLALISHLPFIPELVDRLTGQWIQAKKASCTVLDFDGQAFRFRQHLAPRELREA